jgi:hypothetical protein
MTSDRTTARARHLGALAAAGVALTAVAVTGCGGGDDKDKGKSGGVITATEARSVRLGVPQTEVRRRFGAPAYVGGIDSRRGRDCWYYRIAVSRDAVDPATHVDYRYCFKRERVVLYSSIEYQRSPFEKPPKKIGPTKAPAKRSTTDEQGGAQ